MQKTSKKSSRFSKLDWLLAIGIGLAGLALYIRTLAPGLIPGDSAEFQVLAHQLGIAHTPGYPVYLLLAKLVTFLPMGDIAYRVNLFSAIMATLAAVGVYLAARLLDLNRWSALFGSLILLVSYSFWSQAVIAEVYTAAAAFAIFILVGVLGWSQTGKPGFLFAAGLLGGLSLGIHTTVLLLAPGILIYLWLNRKSHEKGWQSAVTFGVAGVLLGIIIWLAIFVAIEFNEPPANIFNGAYATARSDWGLSENDIQNPWVRIWFIATGQQWRSALAFDAQDMFAQGIKYLVRLPREFSWLAIGLIVVGLAYLISKRRDVAALFVIALLTHWAITLNYRIGDIYVFYIAGYLLMALLAAVGLDWIGRIFLHLLPDTGRFVQAGISLLAIFFAVWPILSPRLPTVRNGQVPFIGQEGYPLWDDLSWMGDQAGMTVNQMKPNSVFFVDWNWLYIYYYAAHIENDRTDLRFIETSPRSDQPGLPDSVIEFVEKNIDSKPIYFSTPLKEIEQAGYEFTRREIWFTTFYKVSRP